MNAFDLLSESPRAYIFQRGSNKTNLGGIFTFIYFIILALITIVYLFDYFKNFYQKFEITYYYNQFRDEAYKEQVKKEIEYEETLTDFSFKILNDEDELVSKNFTIMVYKYRDDDDELEGDKIIEMGEKITRKIDDFVISVLYKCPDNNCTFKKKSIKNYFMMNIVL